MLQECEPQLQLFQISGWKRCWYVLMCRADGRLDDLIHEDSNLDGFGIQSRSNLHNIYMHLPNLKWLDPIEIPLGQPFAQPKVRRDPISARQKWSDIGSNWRKLASSLRRFWSWFVTEEIGESHQISSDFMVGCIIFHHFPNEWPLFLGDTPSFQTNPPGNGSVVVPIPGARTEFGVHFISCHRADRMLKLRQYGDGLLVLPLLLLLLLLLLLIYLASDLIIAIAWIKALG